MKNHQSRIKGKVVRGARPIHPNKTLMKIAKHEQLIYYKFFQNDLDGFDTWWDGVKADLPDFDERLEYLDNLCEDCNAEKKGLKGHAYCPKCKETKGEYK